MRTLFVKLLLNDAKPAGRVALLARRLVSWGDDFARATAQTPWNRRRPVLDDRESHPLAHVDGDRVRGHPEGDHVLDTRQARYGIIDLMAEALTTEVLMHPDRSDLDEPWLHRPDGDEANRIVSVHEHDGEVALVEILERLWRVAHGVDLGLGTERAREHLPDRLRQGHRMRVRNGHDDSCWLRKTKQPPGRTTVAFEQYKATIVLQATASADRNKLNDIIHIYIHDNHFSCIRQ